MPNRRPSVPTLAAMIGMVVLLLVILWLVVTGSGVLPGDNGTEPIADPNEGQGSQTMNLGAWPWTIFLLITTIVLGVAIAWGQFRAGRLTDAETSRTEAATRALHQRERDPSFKD